MTLPLTWDQMPLTPQQQAAVQQLIAWAGAGDGSAPPVTYSQIKNYRVWLTSLSALIEPSRAAMRIATDYYQKQALATFEAANP